LRRVNEVRTRKEMIDLFIHSNQKWRASAGHNHTSDPVKPQPFLLRNPLHMVMKPLPGDYVISITTKS